MTQPMPSDAPLRIGLLWHSLRSDNLGVGALTISHIAIIREAARRAGRTVDCVVIGFGGRLHYPPELAVDEFLITSSRELRPGSNLRKTIAACDIVLDIGAGDSWTDIYTGRRFIWQWLTKECALWNRKPLVLAPQTIGPFNKTITRLIARQTMRRATRIYTRDRESMEYLESEGIAAQAHETVDVAFRLPFARRPRSDNGKIAFGLNVSGLLYAGGYDGRDKLGSSQAYRTMVDGIIEKTLARGDTDVCLVPHVIPDDGSAEDDIAVSRALCARYPGVSMAPSYVSPSAAKSFISGFDILAGSRMHATIAAASSGVAVVPLAYSRKFRGVFQSIGYPLVGDCMTQAPDELVALTLGAFDRRDELTSTVRAGADRAISRLDDYETYLSELFAGHGRAG